MSGGDGLPQSRPPADAQEEALSLTRMADVRIAMDELVEFARLRLAQGGSEQEQFLDVAFRAIDMVAIGHPPARVVPRALCMAAAGAIMLAGRGGDAS